LSVLLVDLNEIGALDTLCSLENWF